MNECVKITNEEAKMKAEFVKYVAMLIRKYGNLNSSKKDNKEVA